MRSLSTRQVQCSLHCEGRDDEGQLAEAGATMLDSSCRRDVACLVEAGRDAARQEAGRGVLGFDEGATESVINTQQRWCKW